MWFLGVCNLKIVGTPLNPLILGVLVSNLAHVMGDYFGMTNTNQMVSDGFSFTTEPATMLFVLDIEIQDRKIKGSTLDRHV